MGRQSEGNGREVGWDENREREDGHPKFLRRGCAPD